MRTKIKSKKVRMVPETDVPYENWIQAWGASNQNKKKDTEELEKALKEDCGCLPDCGCKETKDDKLKGWLP